MTDTRHTWLKVEPNDPADNDFTPVFTAAQFGQRETLSVLAEFRADFRRLIILIHYPRLCRFKTRLFTNPLHLKEMLIYWPGKYHDDLHKHKFESQW